METYNTGKSQIHFTKLKKSDTKVYNLSDSIYVTFHKRETLRYKE